MKLDRIVMQHRLNKEVEIEILFRQLTDPVPTLWKSGFHWQVEAYVRGMEHPPVAIGWVLDVSPARPENLAFEDDPHDPDLECVRVFRDFASADVAYAIIEAARLRWPNLNVKSGCCDEGNEWIDSFRKLTDSRWSMTMLRR